MDSCVCVAVLAMLYVPLCTTRCVTRKSRGGMRFLLEVRTCLVMHVRLLSRQLFLQWPIHMLSCHAWIPSSFVQLVYSGQ